MLVGFEKEWIDMEAVYPVSVKVFIDATRGLGGHFTQLGLQVVGPRLVLHHSWSRHHMVAIFRGKETCDSLKSLSEEIQLKSLVENSQNTIHVVRGMKMSVRFLFVLDWMALVASFPGISNPNARIDDLAICPFCDFNVWDKRNWFTQDIRRWSRNVTSFCDFLPCIGADPRLILYDPMHGLARLLVLVLTAILNAVQELSSLCSRQILNILKQNRWSETSGINPKAAKQFFGKNIDGQLIQLMEAAIEDIGSLILRPTGAMQSLVNSSRSAVNSVRFYWSFIYNKDPSPEDLRSLKQARDDLEAFLWSLDCRMPPAPHYMLNHFIDDVEFMVPIPPYNWINEANEAFHTTLRNLISVTPKLRAKRSCERYDTYDLVVRHSQTLHHCRLRDPLLL